MLTRQGELDTGIGLRANEGFDSIPEHQGKIVVARVFPVANEHRSKLASGVERKPLQSGSEVKTDERRGIIASHLDQARKDLLTRFRRIIKQQPDCPASDVLVGIARSR